MKRRRKKESRRPLSPKRDPPPLPGRREKKERKRERSEEGRFPQLGGTFRLILSPPFKLCNVKGTRSTRNGTGMKSKLAFCSGKGVESCSQWSPVSAHRGSGTNSKPPILSSKEEYVIPWHTYVSTEGPCHV